MKCYSVFNGKGTTCNKQATHKVICKSFCFGDATAYYCDEHVKTFKEEDSFEVIKLEDNYKRNDTNGKKKKNNYSNES